jgi:hypothetical protein
MVYPLSWTNPKLDYVNHTYHFDIRNRNVYDTNALEASINAVNYIVGNYPSPYTLMLSGGVDSQAMLYAWINSKHKFNTFSAVYNFRSNWHDIETINKFSSLYNTSIYFYAFDLLNFLEKEHDDYARKYFCGSPHVTACMKMADLVQEGTTIFSGNCIYPNDTKFVTMNVLGLLHYANLSGKSVVPYFLCETEEIAHSFKKTKEIEILRQESKKEKDAYKFKVLYYHSNGFPVIPQEDKFTGFEKIKEYYDDDSRLPRPITNIDRAWRLPRQISKRNFDLLFRNKYEAMFATHKYTCIC